MTLLATYVVHQWFVNLLPVLNAPLEYRQEWCVTSSKCKIINHNFIVADNQIKPICFTPDTYTCNTILCDMKRVPHQFFCFAILQVQILSPIDEQMQIYYQVDHVPPLKIQRAQPGTCTKSWKKSRVQMVTHNIH